MRHQAPYHGSLLTVVRDLSFARELLRLAVRSGNPLPQDGV